MCTGFQDITVVRFEMGEQDPVHRGIFAFRFMLSCLAPPVWAEIASEAVAPSGRTSFVLQRRAEAGFNCITVYCTAAEAQNMKERLNADILPGVNQRYRAETRDQDMKREAEQAEQRRLLAEAEEAVRNQK